MALDLKFLSSAKSGVLSGSTWPDPFEVESTYGLVQKITKCLLTNSGEDQFFPNYGSNLRRNLAGIPGQNVDQAKGIFSAALGKVVSDLSNPGETDPSSQLISLDLKTLTYSPVSTGWIAEVIVTTSAGTALFTTGV